VLKVARGLVEVRSPARTARRPKCTWGTTEVYPRLHRVPEARIVRVLRRARQRTISASEPLSESGGGGGGPGARAAGASETIEAPRSAALESC